MKREKRKIVTLFRERRGRKEESRELRIETNEIEKFDQKENHKIANRWEIYLVRIDDDRV